MMVEEMSVLEKLEQGYCPNCGKRKVMRAIKKDRTTYRFCKSCGWKETPTSVFVELKKAIEERIAVLLKGNRYDLARADELGKILEKVVGLEQQLKDLWITRPIPRYFRSTPYGKLTKKQFEDWFEKLEKLLCEGEGDKIK